MISYEFEERPEPGQCIEIRPGLKWLRMPLPMVLSHINLWLLRDDDGWTLVDTGLFYEESRQHWSRILANELDGLPLHRVICTHLHPDHVGCAGWLVEKFDIELWMSREEYLLCRILVADTGKTAPEAGVQFYTRAGFSADALSQYKEKFGLFGKIVSPLPESYRRMKDGDRFDIGGREWQVIVGRGHSPEHACLYCPEWNALISGDQILPTISSNVSVHPTEPAANPLADWLTSLADLRERLPEDVLVLPSHGKPFRGAAIRLSELIREHEDGLEKLVTLCEEPRRAVDTFPALFKSRISDGNLIMAAGESIAHLHYLLGGARIGVTTDADGVNWYQRSP